MINSALYFVVVPRKVGIYVVLELGFIVPYFKASSNPVQPERVMRMYLGTGFKPGFKTGFSTGFNLMRFIPSSRTGFETRFRLITRFELG